MTENKNPKRQPGNNWCSNIILVDFTAFVPNIAPR